MVEAVIGKCPRWPGADAGLGEGVCGLAIAKGDAAGAEGVGEAVCRLEVAIGEACAPDRATDTAPHPVTRPAKRMYIPRRNFNPSRVWDPIGWPATV
jgi:hypothetical protein